MPWLSSVTGVLEAWYPGPAGRHRDRRPAVRRRQPLRPPAGDVPGVAVPGARRAPPRSGRAPNGTVQYSEGLDVGYRWYDAKGLTPLFPFGYGLSYTTFSYSNLHVGALPQGGAATVTATVTNTGSRGRAPTSPSSTSPTRPPSGQPPRQLEGFSRVNLAAGRQPDGHVPADPAQPAVLEHQHQRLGHRHRQLRHLGRRLGRHPAADRHAARSPRPSSASRCRHQPGPAGGHRRRRRCRCTVAATDTTSGQTPAFTATGLPAGVVDLAAGHDHRHADHRRHLHGRR